MTIVKAEKRGRDIDVETWKEPTARDVLNMNEEERELLRALFAARDFNQSKRIVWDEKRVRGAIQGLLTLKSDDLPTDLDIISEMRHTASQWNTSFLRNSPVMARFKPPRVEHSYGDFGGESYFCPAEVIIVPRLCEHGFETSGRGFQLDHKTYEVKYHSQYDELFLEDLTLEDQVSLIYTVLISNGWTPEE